MMQALLSCGHLVDVGDRDVRPQDSWWCWDAEHDGLFSKQGYRQVMEVYA